MKALICGSDQTGHDESVRLAFVAGGGVDSEWYNADPITQTVFDYARTNSFDAIIFSYSGLTGFFELANSNPDIMLFMPSNIYNTPTYTDKQEQLVITEHYPTKETGSIFEFSDSTQSADSFSNGYICGQLFDIASQRSCSLQEARIAANLTLATNKVIDVSAAVAYSGSVNLTVGNITAERTGASVSITLGRVIDATGYKIYRNGVLISTQTGLTYTDVLTAQGNLRYTYLGYNDNLESYLSNEAPIKYFKINYLVVR